MYKHPKKQYSGYLKNKIDAIRNLNRTEKRGNIEIKKQRNIETVKYRNSEIKKLRNKETSK